MKIILVRTKILHHTNRNTQGDHFKNRGFREKQNQDKKVIPYNYILFIVALKVFILAVFLSNYRQNNGDVIKFYWFRNAPQYKFIVFLET